MKKIILIVAMVSLGSMTYAKTTPSNCLKDSKIITEIDTAVEFLNCQLDSNPEFDLAEAGSDLLEVFSPELIQELFGIEQQPASLVHKAQYTSKKSRRLYVLVDVSSKWLKVYENGVHTKTCPTSAARPGKSTPRGTFSVKWTAGKNHKSSIYGTPMPYTTNFTGPYAIHSAWGKRAVANLGKRDLSAGCIRTTYNCAKYIQGVARRHGGTVKVRN